MPDSKDNTLAFLKGHGKNPSPILWFSRLLLFCFLLSQQPGLASDSGLRLGIESYNNKNYKQAVKLLGKAVIEDPYNAEMHYYLANSYVLLKDGKSAIKEYAVCFDLEPLSKFGQYSRKALLAFGRRFLGFAVQAVDGKPPLAADDGRSIKQAVALIRAETCERDRLNQDAGEEAAKVAVAVGEQQDIRLNNAARQLIADLTPCDQNVPPALQEELHEIHQQAVFAGRQARQDAMQQATKHMTAAAQRSTSVESSAASLLALIDENPRPGHVKVMAAGTNLYVRNYGLEPEPPIVPLMANWELLPGAGFPLPKEGVSSRAHDSKTSRSESSRLPQSRALELPQGNTHDALRTVSPTKDKPQRLVSKLQDDTFIPGSSKVIVTDVHGRVLLHIRNDGSK